MIDGKIVGCSSEERFSKVKNDERYPKKAIDYLLNEHSIHKDQIKKALKESINGLNNLKTTYEEDITCSASIEYIIELITPHIST